MCFLDGWKTADILNFARWDINEQMCASSLLCSICAVVAVRVTRAACALSIVLYLCRCGSSGYRCCVHPLYCALSVPLWQCGLHVVHAPSLFRSTWTVCASAGYTQCFCLTSVLLTLLHAEELRYSAILLFLPLSVFLWTISSLCISVEPVFDSVGLAGFKSKANAILLA